MMSRAFRLFELPHGFREDDAVAREQQYLLSFATLVTLLCR